MKQNTPKMRENNSSSHVPYGDMSDKQKESLSNRYVQDFLNSPFYAIFIVHRRVMTILYKAYALNGYEIETLLTIGYLCDWREGVFIRGSAIRRRCSRRLGAVLDDILLKLVHMEFITDEKKPEDVQQKWHKIELAPKGIEFTQVWKRELENLVQSERDELTMRKEGKKPKKGGNSKIRENKV